MRLVRDLSFGILFFATVANCYVVQLGNYLLFIDTKILRICHVCEFLTE